MAGKSAGINQELARRLQGVTDPMAVAKIVSAYRAAEGKKRAVARQRKEFIVGVIPGAKIAPDRADALVWEYATREAGAAFESWLKHDHPELFADKKPVNIPLEKPTVKPADSQATMMFKPGA